MKKVNLFIVGSPKCGTTFLAKEFGKNLKIYVPKIKELNYFSFDNLKSNNSYYRSFNIKNQISYEKMFNFSDNYVYYVDASVSYFTFENVAKKIYDYNPDSKIIICYRHPLERSISHYKMDLRMSHTKESFKSLINDKKSFYYRQYILNSLFYKNSKRFVDLFGAKNVHFYSVKKNNYLELSRFLSLDIKINNKIMVNKSKLPKNYFGTFFLKNRNITNLLKLYFAETTLNFFKKFLYKNDNSKLEISGFGSDKLNETVLTDWKKFTKTFLKR